MRYLNVYYCVNEKKFIDALSKNDIILNSSILHDFLSIQDKDSFANKQKVYPN